MAITKVGHVALRVTDLSDAVQHYTEVVGLVESFEKDDEVYLRAPGDQDHHAVVLRQADDAGLDSFGLKFGSLGDLEELEDAAAKAGATTRRASAGEQQGLGEAVIMDLPSGHEVWAYHDVENVGWSGGMENPQELSPSELRASLRAQRLDHVAICVPDVGELSSFLREVMDFESSEVLLDPTGAEVANWMYCTNTMHDIALLPGPPAALHHISFHTDDRQTVVEAADRLKQADVPTLAFGLTRHGIGGFTTTYFHDPAGIRNELFSEPYPTPGAPGLVEPIEWTVDDFARGVFYYECELDQAFLTEVT